jgi:sec-independent protein translocase protein TatA
MPGWLGPAELVPLILLMLLIFGSKRLPEIGRSLGRGMREFKDGVLGKDDNAERRELSEGSF